MIGVDDDNAEKADVRRIQDKWRDILEKEPDWPGHDHGYDIIVSIEFISLTKESMHYKADYETKKVIQEEEDFQSPITQS